MSRNRKHQTAAVRFGPALKALALCLFLGGSGVGYVWQKDQVIVLSQRIKTREVQYEQLRRRNDALERVRDSLQSPGELEARIKQMGLGLVAPPADQILHLADVPSPAGTSGSPVVQLYAEQGRGLTVRR